MRFQALKKKKETDCNQLMDHILLSIDGDSECFTQPMNPNDFTIGPWKGVRNRDSRPSLIRIAWDQHKVSDQ